MKKAFLAIILIGCLISINICCIFVNASYNVNMEKSNLQKTNPSNFNNPPVLSDGIVFPNTITQRSHFLFFKVHYYDEDGDPPMQGLAKNYVLVEKTDPGTPYTGIYNMLVKQPNSFDTDIFLFHSIFNLYRAGNYSVRFCIMYDETTIPCSYVYYPPLEDDPLKFEVINSDARIFTMHPFLFSFLQRIFF